MRTEEQKQRYREQSNAAKQRRRGVCERCGGETRYNGHRDKANPNGVSRLCSSCNQDDAAARARARRGTGSLNSQILSMLQAHPMRMSEIRDALGITSEHTVVTLRRLMAYGLVERPSRGWYRLSDGT